MSALSPCEKIMITAKAKSSTQWSQWGWKQAKRVKGESIKKTQRSSAPALILDWLPDSQISDSSLFEWKVSQELEKTTFCSPSSKKISLAVPRCTTKDSDAQISGLRPIFDLLSQLSFTDLFTKKINVRGYLRLRKKKVSDSKSFVFHVCQRL